MDFHFRINPNLTSTRLRAWWDSKINRLHERALRIAYKDYSSSFATLLEKDRSVTIHEKNMQLLMTEMFKTINNLNPSFMNEILIQRNPPYELRNTNTFLLPRVHTGNYGTETVRYRGQRLWRSLPQEIKDAGSLQQFKNKIRFWKNDDCDCKLCKQYISQLGFLVILISHNSVLFFLLHRFYELCNFLLLVLCIYISLFSVLL